LSLEIFCGLLPGETPPSNARPERLSDGMGQPDVIIRSDVKTGGYREYIEKMCAKYTSARLVLEFSPIIFDFGEGESAEPREISRGELFRLLMRAPRVSFSERLCAFSFALTREDGKRHAVVFDERRSLEKKTGIAAEKGISRMFMLAKDERELPG